MKTSELLFDKDLGKAPAAYVSSYGNIKKYTKKNSINFFFSNHNSAPPQLLPDPAVQP